jgi:hypothetical protein
MLTIKRLWLCALMLLICACVFPSLASASPDSLTEIITKWNNKLDTWRRYYYLSIFLVVLVASAGTLSGIFQKSSSSKLKTAAIYCAYAVTLITVTMNAASVMDYKEIKKEIDNAEKTLDQLTMLRDKSHLKENDTNYQMAIIDQASPLIAELQDIQTKINISSVKKLEFLTAAYAQQPTWVSTPLGGTFSGGSMNFVGVGQDIDLGRAKEKANNSFIAQIDGYIRSNIEALVRNSSIAAGKQEQVINASKKDSAVLARRITKNLKEDNFYFEEVNQDGQPMYKYYLLYKVTTDRLNEALRLQISIYE